MDPTPFQYLMAPSNMFDDMFRLSNVKETGVHVKVTTNLKEKIYPVNAQ